jgi:hypothetical protein
MFINFPAKNSVFPISKARQVLLADQIKTALPMHDDALKCGHPAYFFLGDNEYEVTRSNGPSIIVEYVPPLMDMEVVKAEITHNPSYVNPPELKLHIKGCWPMIDAGQYERKYMRYKKVDAASGAMYFSAHRNYRRFYFHNSRDEVGYGGAVRRLTLEDQTIVQINGSWSSRAGVINKMFTGPEEQTHECCIVPVERGYNLAGAISVELAASAMKKLPDADVWEMWKMQDRYGEITYCVKHKTDGYMQSWNGMKEEVEQVA